jgi:GTP pyrophosphokinase
VSADDMFATIGCGGLKPSQISAYVSDDDRKENALLSAPIVVEGVTFASKVLFSKCCCPILGDEIVAVKTQNNISIHTANCSNLKKCQKDKILKATWKSTVKKEFEVNLKIVAKDKVGFGANLLGSISHLGVNITKMFAKQKNSQCEFKLTLKIKDVSELKQVVDIISKVDGVKSINRSFD